jgi:hypothetical protein
MEEGRKEKIKRTGNEKKEVVTLTSQLTNRTMTDAGDRNVGLSLTESHHAGQEITEPNMAERLILNCPRAIHKVILHVCLQQTNPIFHSSLVLYKRPASN